MSDRKSETDEARKRMETVGGRQSDARSKRRSGRGEDSEEKERMKAARENREVYERHRDHMVPPGLHDPSRLSHLTQHKHTHTHTFNTHTGTNSCL